MSKTLHLWDRSRTTTDWNCSRKRFYTYEFEGRGIVPATNPLELYLGTSVHDGLAAIAQFHTQNGSVDIDLIASTAQKQVFEALMKESAGETEFEATNFAHEQSTLIEGMLRGFYKQVWPLLTKLYPKILAIEQEMTFYHDGLGKSASPEEASFCFMSKPDLVVADEEGSIFYIEYKSTGSKKESWTSSWTRAVQLHSTMRAIEQTLGEKPAAVIVQGLYKGFLSYGKQSSPFCYAYGRNGNPPFTQAEVRYEYAAGFKRRATWEMSGGVKEWVDGMPENVLIDQFPSTPPIFINEALVDDFFAQRAIREGEIHQVQEMMKVSDDATKRNLMNMTFPQKFESCIPWMGRACPYQVLCFGNVEDPLSQGFQPREAHHLPEAERHAETL